MVVIFPVVGVYLYLIKGGIILIKVGFLLKVGEFLYMCFYMTRTRWWFQKCFLCSARKLGKMIQFDEHIFQMGWFNHQPEWRLVKIGRNTLEISDVRVLAICFMP